MTGTIIRSVLSIGARRRFQRNTVAVEKYMLHSHPKEPVPRLLFWIRQIEYRFRWPVRSVTLALDVLIEEGNRRRRALRQIRSRIGQHPDVTQSIIFRVSIIQRVAHYANQRHFRV